MLKVVALSTFCLVVTSSTTNNHGSYGDVLIWIYFERTLRAKECAMNNFACFCASPDFVGLLSKRSQASINVPHSAPYLASSSIH